VITQPLSSRLIEVVARELAQTIAPLISDPAATQSLHMIQHLLATLAIRADHEIAWSVEETQQLDALGESVIAAHPEATGVAGALAALRAARSDSLHLADVSDRYSLASEVLSRSVEEVPIGSPLRTAVERQLDIRLSHEMAVIGEFSLVGRT